MFPRKLVILVFMVMINVVLINSQSNGFPGQVEQLVRGARKSRVSKEFQTSQPAATIEDSSQYLRNFKPYLDNSDTDSLTDTQKVLLKNIADRIARLGPQIIQERSAQSQQTEAVEGRARTNKKRIGSRKAGSKSKTVTPAPERETTIEIIKPEPTKQAIERIDEDDDNVTMSSAADMSRDNAREEFYVRERPQSKNNEVKKAPSTGTGKPTKYHYYPHNQHIYLLPECAIQQVCNAVYVRLNYTQPLCACPSRYRDPCSASLNEDDLHTTKLIGDASKKAITLAKTCEATTEMRECRAPKDWSLLALQNTRTGKSHYLVICRCPDNFRLEGPMAHDQPTYASVPGIRVFGMMCVKPGVQIRRPTIQELPPVKRYQETQQTSQHYPNKISNTNKFGVTVGGNKITLPPYRPTTTDFAQTQYQANYQYLKRPGSIPVKQPSGAALSIQASAAPTFSYGRSEDSPAEEQTEQQRVEEEEEQYENESRKRRSIAEFEEDDDVPAFPWSKVQELQESLGWEE